MKIEKIRLSTLRNSAHFQYHSEFKKLVDRESAMVLKVDKLFADYLALYNNLNDGLKQINKSAITEKIAEADKARDEIWYGILNNNRVSLTHFDQKICDAAKRLKILFDTYGGRKLASKPINEETSDIYNVLQELEGKYAEDVKAIGLEPWIAKLKLRNNAIDKLMAERYNETATKNTVVVKDARAELDKVHDAIIERIHALSVVRDLIERPADYEVFTKTLNAIVDKFESSTKKKGESPQSEEEEGTEDSASQ